MTWMMNSKKRQQSTSNDINMETAEETVLDESDVKRILEKLKNDNRSNKNGK